MRALVLLALLAGCAVTPVPPPVPPPGAPSCTTACARLEQLGCAAANPTPAGALCADVCENIQASGYVEYGVACVTNSQSCEAANACGGQVK